MPRAPAQPLGPGHDRGPRERAVPRRHQPQLDLASGYAAAAHPAAGATGGRDLDVADELGLPLPPSVRKRQRKSVIVIDDDPETRVATEKALDGADIPVRAFAEGRSALTAIAEDKPDVIVMELDIAGSMAGKDVINLIKATMEWVDIPIVLYSRAPITSQREARTVHGADDFVSKQDG